MAAPRRIQLVNLSSQVVPVSPNNAVQDFTQSQDSITPPALFPDYESVPSTRMELVLFEPDQRRCPEFSYPELVEMKIKHSLLTIPGNKDFSDVQEVANKDGDELDALSKHFEEQHGGAPKLRRDRLRDLVDMGYGYDEDDSFIDNSEAYDELVPACLATKHGGFYINSGTLHFRKVSAECEKSEADDFEENVKPKKRKLRGGPEGMIIKKKRKKDKQPGEDEAKSSGRARKPPPAKNGKQSKPLGIDGMLRKFHKEKLQQLQTFNQCNKDSTLGDTTTVVSEESISADPSSRIDAGNVVDVVKASTDAVDMDGLSSKDQGTGPTGVEEKEISEAIQPVKLPSSIPEDLPPMLKQCLQKLTEKLKQGSKMESFDPEINQVLLNASVYSKELPDEARARIFSYLASRLSCKKSALLKRAKSLRLLQLDNDLWDLTERLEETITSAMPEQIERFNEHCQAHSEARAARLDAEKEQRPVDRSDEEEGDKGGKRVFGPRKRFRWTEELREMLSEVVKLKMCSYELESPGGQTLEDYLKSFLDANVKPLWPKGWMQSRILLIESRRVHCHITGVMARRKLMTIPKAQQVQETVTKAQPVPGGLRTSKLQKQNADVERALHGVHQVSTEVNNCLSSPEEPSVVRKSKSLPTSPAQKGSSACAGAAALATKPPKLICPWATEGESAALQARAAMEGCCGDPALPTPSLSLQATSYLNVQSEVLPELMPLHALLFPEAPYASKPSENTQICQISLLSSPAAGTFQCALTHD